MVYMIYVTFSGLALEAKLSKLVDGITLADMTLKINEQMHMVRHLLSIVLFFKYFSPTF